MHTTEMAISASDSRASAVGLRLRTASKLIITIYGLALLCIGLGSRTLTQHEVFAAYPAKEMLRHDHWIVQMFAGIPRTAKPPTTGWFIAATMWVTHSDAQWVPRIPSVLAGIATALLIAWFAARFFGDRVGLLTGLIQLTCYSTILQARLAEADMLATAAVAAAFVCFGVAVLRRDEGPGDPPSRLLSVLFYVFAGLAFLLKAIPVVFIFLGALSYALLRRERRIWKFFVNPLGIVLFLALVIAWPLTAYLSYPPILKSWKYELFGTASGQLGYDPIYAYLLSIPAILMPWTPMIAVGVWIGFRKGYDDLRLRRLWQCARGGTWRSFIARLVHGLSNRPLAQFLLCWFVPGLMFLHLSAFKHKHYSIPMLPPLSIAGALGLLWLLQRIPPRSRIRVVVTTFSTILAVVGITNGFVVPRYFDDYRYAKDLALTANIQVPSGPTLYIIDPEPRVEPQIAYYLRPPIRRYPDAPSFIAMAKGTAHPLYVVTTAGQIPALQALGQTQILAEAASVRRHQKPADRLVVVRVAAGGASKTLGG